MAGGRPGAAEEAADQSRHVALGGPLEDADRERAVVEPDPLADADRATCEVGEGVGFLDDRRDPLDRVLGADSTRTRTGLTRYWR